MFVKGGDTERVNRKIMAMTKLLADLLDVKKNRALSSFMLYSTRRGLHERFFFRKEIDVFLHGSMRYDRSLGRA